MKISVITATYNSAATVGDTLESVLRQTHRDVELIVVDGASKDGTMEVVRGYEERFGGRLRYVSEPDRGLYDAMNKGIGMATGEVVGVLNSDDFYAADDVLEAVARRLDQGDGVEAVYGDVMYVDAHDTAKDVRHYSSRIFRPWLMRLGFMPAHPSFYCRRRVYERCGGFDTAFPVAADFENLLRLLYVHRTRTAYIGRDFVRMRTGGASSSGMASHRQIMRDHLRALRKNHVHSCMALLLLRYIYKVGELLTTKVRRMLKI